MSLAVVTYSGPCQSSLYYYRNSFHCSCVVPGGWLGSKHQLTNCSCVVAGLSCPITSTLPYQLCSCLQRLHRTEVNAYSGTLLSQFSRFVCLTVVTYSGLCSLRVQLGLFVSCVAAVTCAGLCSSQAHYCNNFHCSCL